MAGLSACTAASASGLTEGTVLAAADRPAAPTVTGELLDGTGRYDLADHKGDVVVINFWGSWCGPCVAEADALEQTYQATKDSGVAFVGINVHDTRDAAARVRRATADLPERLRPGGQGGARLPGPADHPVDVHCGPTGPARGRRCAGRRCATSWSRW